MLQQRNAERRVCALLKWKLASEHKTDVPCNGCIECCRSGQGLFLHPDQGDDVESYRTRTAQGGAGETVFVLETTPNGACIYLGDRGCTIYERRPLICRTFDCRKHYLILPRQDRDNLVRLKLSSRTVFNAGRARLATLSAEEKQQCLKTRDEFFS